MAVNVFSLAKTKLALQNLIKNSPAGAEQAMWGVIKSMENDAKVNGKYVDRTGNLRNSITGVVLGARETSINHHSGETVNIRNAGNDIVAILYAGMEYGIHVEFLDHKDVLGLTVKAWKPKIKKILGAEIKTRGTYQRGFEKGR